MIHLYSGKVRDIYQLDNFVPPRLLMVASNRVSAFDVIMNEQVANKGAILTAMSSFWMDHCSDIVENHLVSSLPTPLTLGEEMDESFIGRAVVVKKAQMIELECIVRGYLAGSAYREYRDSGTIHGQHLPRGLNLATRLPEPMFCPSIKNHLGHDENISIDQARSLFGSSLVDKLMALSIEIYNRGSVICADASIILADTKFEFGMVDEHIVLCDEVLTPDSSRFWDADRYVDGVEPIQFDKQPLRDYLDSLDWNKTPPPPRLASEVLASLSERYASVYRKISGSSVENWLLDAAQAYSSRIL